MSKTSKIINLFATGGDWHNLLASIEDKIEVFYVKSGIKNDTLSCKESHRGWEGLGSSISGNLNNDSAFLCVSKNASIKFRGVDQRDGGRIDFIDQMENPDTVSLKIGGQFGERILVAGQIGTISDSDWSLHAFSIFHREVKKQFVKIKSYFVGNEALELLRNGWRLTANVRSPKIYDLQVDDKK